MSFPPPSPKQARLLWWSLSALAIGVAVYFVQVPFSAWWLRRYRYGPVEWLWRTLMYGVAQPMRQTT